MILIMMHWSSLACAPARPVVCAGGLGWTEEVVDDRQRSTEREKLLEKESECQLDDAGL